uniref:Uncharacterized protein n=1 Tax=Acrobeloides nanus TaxID=290746 RepID=A0A914CX24_9BILA
MITTTLFPAYEQEKAPSIPGFNNDGFQSSATYDSFARTAEQKRKEDEKRKQAERLKRKKEAEQDKSHYAVKTIGMYSSSENDDDDCIIVSHTVKENTERTRSPSLERIDYDGATTSRVRNESPKRSRDDRKKKHKKRHRHSSTSSSDGSYRKKKKKKRHRRVSSSESGELSESPIRIPVKKVETWSLMDLEKFRSSNIASLIVSDVKADYKNTEFESIYHLFVPRYRPYIRALIGAPERLNHKLFNYRGLPEKNQIT